MTLKKGNKKIEFEVKEEVLQKWDKVAKILGFTRASFIRNAVDKYIIDIFEAVKPICEKNDNININLKKHEYPKTICPVCKKEIDKRGSVQHINSCKKEEDDIKQQKNTKNIPKEKRDRLKNNKKYEDVGRSGRMKENIP